MKKKKSTTRCSKHLYTLHFTLYTLLLSFAAALPILNAVAQTNTAPPEKPMPRILVSENKRFLMREDGTPFFYLADTAWELFHRLTDAETEDFLKTRAEQGFTALQIMILEEHDGLDVPSVRGETALIDRDPTRPNEAYFAHIDRIVKRANQLGLTMALLPTWGDKWNKKWGKGPEIFNPENARVYGKWLGIRYRDAGVIWVLGGDRPVENDTHRAIIRAMAEGLREGDQGRHLITFHPCGGQRSAQYFHNEPWLDFNMAQTGHNRNSPNYKFIATDYALDPTKPCLDAEPGYEEHVAGFNTANGFLGAHDARRAAYWAVFAGACGHTYGCHAVWQFWDVKRQPVNFPYRPWRDSLRLEGADTMRHLRALIERLPYFSRRPAQDMLHNDPPEEHRHIAVTSDGSRGQADATYILAYFPFADHEADLDTTALKTDATASWFDPRTGQTAGDPFPVPRAGSVKLRPPAHLSALDWVLVIESK